MIKHIFLDMDGTVCNSKQIISPHMKRHLEELQQDIIVISGQTEEHMNYQLAGLECTRMPQSGNIMPMWYNSLSKAESIEIYCHIAKLQNSSKHLFSLKRTDYVDNRGCQISLSFIGHGATYDDKIKFDPTHEKRKKALKHCPFEQPTLDCTIAGTTCLDYTRKDGKKGDNIKKCIEYMKWNPDECIYYGDALFKGGNDESVIGVIDTVEVSGPDELLEKLKMYE